MNAEEYLVDRIQKLENDNAFLERQKEILSKKNEEQNKVIIAFAKILETLMEGSDLDLEGRDKCNDSGLAKLVLDNSYYEFNGDLVCDILQEAYNNTHVKKPWEPPTTDPKFYDICHRQAEILLKDKEEKKND